MRRQRIYRLRLGEAEHDDLERRADDRGVAKADVIREAMGWEPEGLIRRDTDSPRQPSGKNPAAPPPPPSDDGPGARALSELARRLAGG